MKKKNISPCVVFVEVPHYSTICTSAEYHNAGIRIASYSDGTTEIESATGNDF